MFRLYENNSCTGTPADTDTLTAGLRVTTPGPNPDLPPKCGINVILVLDESGSIGSNAENVRRASRAFLNSLSGTGSKVSIVDFSTRAARPVAYTQVTGRVDPDGQNATGTIDTTFEPYLKTGYVSNGWTNWEDAFYEVKVANDGATKADLVVFMTDGDPTARNTGSGGGSGGVVDGLVEGEVEALRALRPRGRPRQGAEVARPCHGRGRGSDRREQRAAADGGLRIRQVARARGELRGSRLHPRDEFRRSGGGAP